MATADKAHFHLETFTPDLLELIEYELFTPEEIKKVTRKVSDFEMKIQARISRKQDFVHYLQYLTNLESLRKVRRSKKEFTKVIKTDYSLVSRIHALYQKTLKKFKGDVELWLQYIEWSKFTGSNKTLGKTFARAIQLHPSKPVFWILAAKWEYEENANIASGRVLLLRGLRMNPTDEKLWIEYFRLEMMYHLQLKQRQEILLKETVDVSQEALKECLIPRAVLKKAFETMNGLEFKKQLLVICKEAKEPKAAQDIYDSLDASDVESLCVLLEKPLDTPMQDPEFPEALKTLAYNYMNALKESPNEYVLLNAFKTFTNLHLKDEYLVAYAQGVLLELLKWGESHMATSTMYKGYLELKFDAAVLERALETCPSVELWCMAVDADATLFSRALSVYPESKEIWIKYLQSNPTKEHMTRALELFPGDVAILSLLKLCPDYKDFIPNLLSTLQPECIYHDMLDTEYQKQVAETLTRHYPTVENWAKRIQLDPSPSTWFLAKKALTEQDMLLLEQFE